MQTLSGPRWQRQKAFERQAINSSVIDNEDTKLNVMFWPVFSYISESMIKTKEVVDLIKNTKWLQIQ